MQAEVTRSPFFQFGFPLYLPSRQGGKWRSNFDGEQNVVLSVAPDAAAVSIKILHLLLHDGSSAAPIIQKAGV